MWKTPQEVEVWYILPAIRRELTMALLECGLAQKKVAGLLGVTEPAVSQYLRSKRGKEIRFNNSVREKIRLAAKRIIKKDSGVRAEVQNICDEIEKSGLLCDIHKRQEKIPRGCNICKRLRV